MNNIEIIPAIMPKDFADLSAKATQVASYVQSIQLDIMDGDFVPKKTWPYDGDIIDFQKVRTKEMSGHNLITVVDETQIDREIVDMVMAPMLGHNSNNVDPLQPLQIVTDEE